LRYCGWKRYWRIRIRF